MKKKLIRAITIIGMSKLLFANTAYAKENMVPDYEMKFLLDSDKVLNNDHELNSEYRDLLDTGKITTRLECFIWKPLIIASPMRDGTTGSG